MAKKYQIFTYHPFENGYDEKPEESSMQAAKKTAKRLLFTDNPDFRWYEKVFILSVHKIHWVFDKYNRNGRKPYEHEMHAFSF